MRSLWELQRTDPALAEMIRQERSFKRAAEKHGLTPGTPAFDKYVDECFEAEAQYQKNVSQAMSCGMA